MNACSCNILLATAVLLAASSIPGGIAEAADGPAFTSRTGGFLTKSDRRAPSAGDNRVSGLVDKLCARTATSSRRSCPAGVHGGVGAADDVSAGLPHLRLNIILRQMSNAVVSGSGVDSLGLLQEPWATWKIVSTAADVSIPAPAAEGFGLPVPPPGATWGDIPHANGLFQGIIHNGCIGPAPTFDLTLDSNVYRPSSNQIFGQVHLVDSVQGPGYYNFKYTIRATDESGNVSDFVFSGDADAFCTGQSELAAGMVGGFEAAFTTTTVASQRLDSGSLRTPEYITQADIDRAGGRHKVFVPGIGNVYVMGLKPSSTGKTCAVSVETVIKAAQLSPPPVGVHFWWHLTEHDCGPNEPLRECCGLPFGGGCYVLVLAT
jgi:hypothetical protein